MMRRARLASSLFIAILAFASTANAAPTVDVALEHYQAALASRGFSLAGQGFLFETLEGECLLGHNEELAYNPASVVKVATSAAALERLGPDYRYPTAFYTNGIFEPATGDLCGDLILVGSGDPSFITENAFLIARELNAQGIRHVTGSLIVKGRFYCNYSTNPAASGRVVKLALDRATWTGGIESAYGRYRVQTGVDDFQSIVVDGPVTATLDVSLAGLEPLFTFRSMPLLKILKQQNNFSNNWISHVVGYSVGGADGVKSTLASSYGIAASRVRLATTSGLGTNAMRPSDVTTLLRGLIPSLSRKSYTPADLLPVAGLDPGTLDERYTTPGLVGSVVAKTGTLDGVSTLAGYMYTRDRGIVVFAILNKGGSPGTFRPLQDMLVREVFEACGGPMPLVYTRPVGYAEVAGALIERAPATLRAAPQAQPAEVR